MVLFGLYGNLKNPGGLPQTCPYQLALMEHGCSEEQAKHLGWLVKERQRGKTYGFFVGSFLAYSWGHWFSYLKPKFGYGKILFQLTILGGSIYFGDYVYAGHRVGGNTPLASMFKWNNNMFEHNREQLQGNFHILTRKFQTEQKRQFNEKRLMLSNPKNRKWIFNEDLYTEEQFLEMVRRRNNNIMPWHQKRIIQAINDNNTHKAQPQRIIRTEKYAPFDAAKHVNSQKENLHPRIYVNYYPLD